MRKQCIWHGVLKHALIFIISIFLSVFIVLPYLHTPNTWNPHCHSNIYAFVDLKGEDTLLESYSLTRAYLVCGSGDEGTLLETCSLTTISAIIPGTTYRGSQTLIIDRRTSSVIRRRRTWTHFFQRNLDGAPPSEWFQLNAPVEFLTCRIGTAWKMYTKLV